MAASIELFSLPMTSMKCFPVGLAWAGRRVRVLCEPGTSHPCDGTSVTSKGCKCKSHLPSLLTGWGQQHRHHVKAWPQRRWGHFLWSSPACRVTVTFLNLFRNQLLSRDSHLSSVAPEPCTSLAAHQNTEASLYPRPTRDGNASGGQMGGAVPSRTLEQSRLPCALWSQRC